MCLALLGTVMLLRVCLITSLLVASAACSNSTSAPLQPTESRDAASVSIEKNGPVISGTVYAGATGDQPLADANVVVVSGSDTRTTRTNASGAYMLSVPTGEGTITASKPGYAPKAWLISVSNDVVVNFSLSFQ